MKLQSIPLHFPSTSAGKIESLQKVAISLEASFLTEMLKAAGLGKSRETLGGGAGEDVFSSLMVEQQAQLMADKGGIGLAEHIVSSLIRRQGNV